MSQENVDLLRRLNDGTNRGELSEMDPRSFFTPMWSSCRFGPRRRAHTTVSRASKGSSQTPRRSFERFEPHYEFLDLGERVLAWGTIHVRAQTEWHRHETFRSVTWSSSETEDRALAVLGSKQKALKAVGLEE